MDPLPELRVQESSMTPPTRGEALPPHGTEQGLRKCITIDSRVGARGLGEKVKGVSGADE